MHSPDFTHTRIPSGYQKLESTTPRPGINICRSSNKIPPWEPNPLLLRLSRPLTHKATELAILPHFLGTRPVSYSRILCFLIHIISKCRTLKFRVQSRISQICSDVHKLSGYCPKIPRILRKSLRILSQLSFSQHLYLPRCVL